MLENSPNFNIPLPNKTDEETDVADSLTAGLTIIDTELKNRKNELDAHKIATDAHDSQNITHADSNIKVALDEFGNRVGYVEGQVVEVDQRVNNIIAQSGTSDTEVVDARGTFPVLRERLDDVTSSLAQSMRFVSVLKYGAKGDGITDDSDAIEAAIRDSNGVPVMFPGYNPTFLVTRPIVYDSYVELVGVGGSLKNIYNGKQSFPKIKYTGNGTFLKIDGTNVDSLKIHPSGSKLSNLVIEGNENALCAIKMNERDCIATEMRNITFENVFIYNFTSGWAFEIHEVYTPIFINCNVQNCGGVGLLVNAHATTFIGGSLEQCSFGIYNKGSRPVSFTGTTIEGISASRPSCTIPSGFSVWDSWVGSDNPRPTVTDYEGIGVVSFGGQVILDKCYFEANDWNVVGELNSHISLLNSYNEATANTKGSVNFAGLYLNVEGNHFALDPIKNHIYLEASIPANYCYIKENNRLSVTDGKLINSFTGHAGVFESEELWDRTINYYNTKMSVDTITLHPKTPSAAWNQLFVDPNDGKLKFKDNTGAIKIVNLT